MAGESAVTLASYLFVPVFIVIGLALFIHCTLVLVRSRTEASDYEIVDTGTSGTEGGGGQRSWTFIRRHP